MGTTTLRFLSGGAAQGLVRGLKPEFETVQACALDGQFGAVGAMRDRLLAGDPCDLVWCRNWPTRATCWRTRRARSAW